MNQREMEKEIWSWLYGYALNIGESEAFIETLEEHMSEDLGIPFRHEAGYGPATARGQWILLRVRPTALPGATVPWRAHRSL